MVTGFSAKTIDGKSVRFRWDFDPDKKAHINVEIGKGSSRQKIAFVLPENISQDQLVKHVQRNFNR